jgi:hypothetical protein
LLIFQRSREEFRQLNSTDREENPKGHKAQKRTDAQASRLCMRLKTLKLLKQHEGIAKMMNFSPLPARIKTLKSKKAYESSHIEITCDRVQEKLKVKRLSKTYRPYQKQLDTALKVSF